MNLFNYFHKSAIRYKENTALVVDNIYYSYHQIFQKSQKISYALNQYKDHQQVGIFTNRSLPGYTGILGTLASGKTYVPLNTKSPLKRNEAILKTADLRLLILDKSGMDQVLKMVSNIDPKSILFFPEIKKTEIPPSLKEKFKFYSHDDLIDLSESYIDAKPDQYAYIMFTSGSTGTPKGVPISHKSVISYITHLTQNYNFEPADKFSQTFDLTFDLSVHDLFISWTVGAELYVIPDDVLFAPAKFIRDNKLTIWFSVPSLAQSMNRFRMLQSSSFPSLRYSFFCGEPLPKTTATAWQKAAPDSVLVNIYGPTEATIGISNYRIPREQDKILDHNGIVSIGNIFSTHDFCLINEKNEIVDSYGELCLSGAQVTSGYWNDSDKKSEQFFSFPFDQNKVWYRTGDLVKLQSGKLFFITRKDFQVKIRGYRIELEEINLKIREFTHCSLVYTLPHPVLYGVAGNLYSFIDNSYTRTPKDILDFLKERLPAYMIPKDIFILESFPMNSNGKINIKELISNIKK